MPTRLSPCGPNAWVTITRTSSSTVTCGPVTARWRPVMVRLRRSTGSMRVELAMALGTWQAVCERHRKVGGPCHLRVYSSLQLVPGLSSYRGDTHDPSPGVDMLRR